MAAGDEEGASSLVDRIASYGYTPGEKPTPIVRPCVASRSRRKSGDGGGEKPSSYIRAMVDGKEVVVSSYFPLPPGAISPVVIPRSEVYRGKARRMRELSSARPRKRKANTRASTSNSNVNQEEKEGKNKPARKSGDGEGDKPSSYVRAMVDGKEVVVSSYFPLPPGATSLVFIPRSEVDRGRAKLMRELSSARPRKRKANTGVSTSNSNENQEKEKKKRPARKRSSGDGEGEKPSSYIRAIVDGKEVVVSSYFPLPPGASSAAFIPRSEVDRGRAKRMREFSTLPRKKKRASTSNDNGNQEKEEKKKPARNKRDSSRSQRSHLSAAEKMSDAYMRVHDDIFWVSPAPPSHHNLLQEQHSFDPWRVLIICMLLNITTGKQVKKVLPGLFLSCRDAKTTINVPVEEIEESIQSLGLQKKRAKMIKRFSEEYLSSDWTHVTQLHGIGKYAADAYAIFCVGKPEAVIPEDHKLMEYWNFVCSREESTSELETTLSACNSCCNQVLI